MSSTASRIRHISLVRVTGEHLMPANQHHLALAPEPTLPQRVATERDSVHAARATAVRRLGTGWVLHPAYEFKPRHSTDPKVYEPARAEYFAEVALLATVARARNPAWQRAEAVRRAITRPSEQPQ